MSANYQLRAESDVLRDIQIGAVPIDVLVDQGGWKHACRVRGHHIRQMRRSVWTDLCRKGGWALSRHNSRGY